MSKVRLRKTSSSPILGWNLHILHGHDRLRFVMANYQPGRILDVACGEGGFSIYLARNGNNVTAIDVLESPVHSLDKRVDFIQMNAFDIIWKNIFNTVLLMEIIEHVDDPLRLVRLCLQALKPGGRLLVTTPHVGTWDCEPDHIWRFDEDGVKDLFAGLTPCSFVTFTDDIFVYAVALKPTALELSQQ